MGSVHPRGRLWALWAWLAATSACVDLGRPWDARVSGADAGATPDARRSDAGRTTIPFSDVDAAAQAPDDEEDDAGLPLEPDAQPVGGSGGTAGAGAGGTSGPPTAPTVTPSWDFEGTAVAWAGSSATSYRVQRGTAAAGPFSDVASGLTGSPWVDKNAPATQVFYVVVAESSSGHTASAPVGYTRAPNLLTNPSFEADGATTQSPMGWWSWAPDGNLEPDYSEDMGATAKYGRFHGTHYATAAYQIYTFQQAPALAAGAYTATAWVKSSGGQPSATFGVKVCDGSTLTTVNVAKARGDWKAYSLSFNVATTGCYEVGFWSTGNANQWLSFDGVSLRRAGP